MIPALLAFQYDKRALRGGLCLAVGHIKADIIIIKDTLLYELQLQVVHTLN